MTLAQHLQTGIDAEQAAEEYLQKHGLTTILKNYRVKVGEIDLIMQDGDDTVFVEVRFRFGETHGDALASITPTKQGRIIRAAKAYLQEKDLWDKVDCRFDVVAINGAQQLNWVKSAYSILA